MADRDTPPGDARDTPGESGADDRLVDWAQAVADGRAVDWEQLRAKT